MEKLSFRQRLGNLLLRQNVADPTHWLTNILVKSAASSGVSVDPDSSLKVSAVYACVKVIAEAIASLPLNLYRRKGEGKELAADHYLYSLIHDAPNEFQTSFEWRECLVAHQLLRGNSYNYIRQLGSGKIAELIPLNPGKMTPERIDGLLVYHYIHEDGKNEDIPAEKLWHLRNMPISTIHSGSFPEGMVGLSPISIARESVGIAMAADEYGGRYFANNASIGLALKYPESVRLSQEAKTFLNGKLAEYADMRNKFKSIIMDQGGSLEKMGMSNEDSQFLESRNFQVEEIARIYRVPPVLIGHPTNTMTYASAEQLFLSFATYTIRPWCVRIEQSMNKTFLTKREKGQLFFEFNMDGLLRGDMAGRAAAYVAGRNWGWLSVDEIRAKENLNPLPDNKGQVYLQPLNMVEAGKEPPPTQPASKGDQNA